MGNKLEKENKSRKSESNILIAFILNLFFSIFEFFGGLFTNSIAIISDAIHDFGDAISIGISYFLEKKSKNKPDNKYTYGYIRYSTLGALITNVILIIGSALVIYSAINRFINPVEINYDGMIVFAIFGVLVNFIAVYSTKDGKSLNQKAVNLHLLEDVLGWLVVLIGAIVVKFTEINRIDAVISILVALFILINAFKGMKKIVDLFLEKIPDGIKVEDIKKHLLEIDGVKNVHHIHIWSIDGFNNLATMHVVTDSQKVWELKEKIRKELKEHQINHTTIEIENDEEQCVEKNCVVESVEGSEHVHGHHHHHH